jgi:hypothetical protein
MDKYNRLCANIEDQMAADCNYKNSTSEYCELLRTIYSDCVKYRDRKLRTLAEEKTKEAKIKSKVA